MNRRKLLVVDADGAGREILRAAFDKDYDIVMAADGRAALEILRSTRVDGVITGMIMDGMDSYELIHNMRAIPELTQIPVVAVTGHDDVSRSRLLEAGADDLIDKPFLTRLVVQRVKNVMNRSASGISLDEYHRVFDNNPVAFAIVQIDADGKWRIIYANRALTALEIVPDIMTQELAGTALSGFRANMVAAERTDETRHWIEHCPKNDGYYDITAYRVGEGCVGVSVSDITGQLRSERSAASAKLKLSEDMRDRLADVIDNLQNGIIVYRVSDGSRMEMLSANPFANELLGIDDVPPDEFTLEAICAATHPDDRNRLTTSMKQLFAADSCTEGTYRTRNRRDGDYIWLNVRSRSVRQCDGTAIIYSCVNDISQLKSAENKLAESEREIRALLESVPGGIFKYSAESDIMGFVSSGMLAQLGYTEQEFRSIFNNRFSDMVYEEDRERVIAEINSMARPNGLDYCEYRIRKKDGTLSWFYDVGYMEEDANGRRWFYVVIVNIDARKKLEQQLRESEDSVAAAVRHSNMEFWEYDIKTGRAYVGEKSQQEYGLPHVLENFPDDWIAQGMLHADDIEKYRDCIARIKRGEPYVEFECRTRRRDDVRFIWRRVRYSTIFDDNGAAVKAVATAQNIDTIKNIEHRFNQMLSQNGMWAWELDIATRQIVDIEKNDRPNPFGIIGRKLGTYVASQCEHGPIHPDDTDGLRTMFKKMCAGEVPVSAQVRLWSERAQKYIWYEIMYSRPEEDGNSGRLLGTCRDISAEKWLEERYNEEQQAGHEADPLLISVCCMNLTRHRVESFEVVGQPVKTDDQQRFTDYRQRVSCFLHNIALSDEDNARLSCDELLSMHARGEHSFVLEYMAQYTATGEHMLIHMDCRLLERPSTGDVCAFFYERNYAEQYITRETTGAIMKYDYDFAGLIFAATGRMYIMGRGDKSMVPQPFNESYDDDVRELFHRFGAGRDVEADIERNMLHTVQDELQRSELYTYEFDLNENDTGVRRKQLRYAYADREMSVIAVMRTDIDDLVKSEQRKQRQLEKALDSAEKASNAKSEFLATMSHEIRTPMNVVLGMTALARESAADPAEVHDYLDKIEVASQHLLNLVNNVLDMSKIESGEFELHPERYEHSEFESYIDSVVRPLCTNKRISLVENVNGSCVPVMIDKLRINQVMFNLLSNAVKFTPDGGNIYLVCTYTPDGANVICDYQISDTGIGMSEEFQRRLFKPFSQENNGILSPVQGTGLGLSISKGIVEKMGGTISVMSVKGHGTTFSVRVTVPAAHTEAPTESKKPVGEIHFDGINVIVAEDHAMNRMIVERMLRSRGANTILAENGRIAVDKFMESAPGSIAAILMDIRMPVMDGLEAAREIRVSDREDSRTVPIIAMTANAYDSDREKSRLAGMDYHLTKPIVPAELYRTLYGFIKKRDAGNAVPDEVHTAAAAAQPASTAEASEAVEDAAEAGMAIYRVERDGFVVKYCSAGLPLLSGRNMEEYMRLMNEQRGTGIYPPDEQFALENIRRGIEQKQPISEIYRITHANGNLIWVHLRADVIGEENGCPVLMAMFSDVSDDNRKYRAILENAGTPVVVLDDNTRSVIFANRSALELTQKDAAGYKGMTCSAFLCMSAEICSECPLNGEMDGDYVCVQREIRGKKCLLNIRRIKLGARNALVITVTDMSVPEKARAAAENSGRIMRQLLDRDYAAVLMANPETDEVTVLSYTDMLPVSIYETDSYAEMTGRIAEYVRDKCRTEFERMFSPEALRAAVRSGNAGMSMRCRFLCSDRYLRDACIRRFAASMPGGRPNCVIITLAFPEKESVS